MSDEKDTHYNAFKADMEAQKTTLSRRSNQTVHAGEFFAKLREKFHMTPESEAEIERETQRLAEQDRLALEARWKTAEFNSICPPEFRQPWDWQKCSARALLYRDKLQAIMDWKADARGLYIAGESGLCKTRAVWVLIRRLIVDERRSVKFLDGSKFGNEASAAYCDPATTERWLSSLEKTPILVIDDLAKRWTPAIEDALFDIINRRTNWHRPTILTTNYAGDDLRTMSAGRKDNGTAEARNIVDTIMRRVGDYFDVIDLAT